MKPHTGSNPINTKKKNATEAQNNKFEQFPNLED